MDVCYFCGTPFDETTTLKHDEHVIQQAIGGSLTKKDILCKSCGESLGNDIDVPFNKIFDGIATRLDIKKDRGTSKKSIKGKVISELDCYGADLQGIEVVWKDFKVAPVKPTHRYIESDKKIVIYALSYKRYKEYLKKNKDKIEALCQNNNIEIEFCDDINAFIEFEFNLDNVSFKRGLAKIAVGFASSHGISREKLSLVLKINNDNTSKIKDDLLLVPYRPLGKLDIALEKSRVDVGFFPTHTLILFNTNLNPSFLVCYIELFSTFQYYLVLSADYDGEKICEYHCQRLEKEEAQYFEIDRRSYKERESILGYLGISNERIKNRYEKEKDSGKLKCLKELEGIEETDKNYEKYAMEVIECIIINEELIKQKNEINFEKDVEMKIKSALDTMSCAFHGNNENDILISRKNFFLFYKKLEDGSFEFNSNNYRRYFVDDDCNIKEYVFTLLECQKESIDYIKEHNHFRFENLERYTQKKLIDKKFDF